MGLVDGRFGDTVQDFEAVHQGEAGNEGAAGGAQAPEDDADGGGDHEGALRKRPARDHIGRSVPWDHPARPLQRIGVARTSRSGWSLLPRLVPMQRCLAGVAAPADTGVDHAEAPAVIRVTTVDDSVRVGDWLRRQSPPR